MAHKKKPGRKSSMMLFKIKYTNNKGIMKTRNIKATSESKAMSEITDLDKHHYTISEPIDQINNTVNLPSGLSIVVKPMITDIIAYSDSYDGTEPF